MRTDVVRLGRLSGERTGEMMHFLSSMRSDRCIADADILVDLAHVLMLEKQKIIDPDIAKQLLSALLELFDEGIPEEVFDERFEDVHAGMESLLVESVGVEAGGRMHMGRSRNDEVATCIRIRLREDLLKQMSALLKVREVLVALAEQHIETVMPGFTHMQHAQPTTLAHHLLAYEQAFSRDFDRLKDAYVRVNQSPLGAAAFASTGYPISREYTASLLGFDGLMTNTMDAVATRDFALETLADLSILMANTSRLCEELVIWSTSFVKFVTLMMHSVPPPPSCPRKRTRTLPRSCGQSRDRFSVHLPAHLTVKGLPMSYNRDLQELTPNIWRGMRDAKESLRLLIDMLSSATFDTGRMKEEAGKGFSTATELADTLVRTYGIPFRTAHTIVGRAVQKGDLSLSTLEEAAREVAAGISLVAKGLTQKNIDEALDVPYSIALRKAPGGPAPFAVRIALDERKKQLDADSAHIDQRLAKLSKAKEDLIAKARRLVA